METLYDINNIIYSNNDNYFVSDEIENLIISEKYLNLLISNVYTNNLLILFGLTFFSTLYCCAMKHRKNHEYVILPTTEPIKGEAV